MTEQGTVIFYHGTDLDSLLSILNEGLQVDKLRHLQSMREVQSGIGWYVTDDIRAAWYFATIAYGNTYKGAVCQMLCKSQTALWANLRFTQFVLHRL
jgi:hypothetical protein